MDKRRKAHGIGKRLMSGLVAMTMATQFISSAALAANAAVSEQLVKSLGELYDGDTERARQELEALYEAGIIDENGNMVKLDICEDGKETTLEDVMAKITAEEKVGDLTINGHAVTQEKVTQINAVKNALEVAKLLAKDVEITDEHVENLENLIQGIGDGSVDVNSALESGTLSLKSSKLRTLGAPLGAGNENTDPEEQEEEEEDDGYPKTKTFVGELSDVSNGKYTQPFINGQQYEEEHQFTLTDPDNKAYFTDSVSEGVTAEGIITFSFDKETAELGDTVTVTASLNKAQNVPVSFEYKTSGTGFVVRSGSVTWEAGDTEDKTFEVNIARNDNELWIGKRAFVINIVNLKNAVIKNGSSSTSDDEILSDNVTAWSGVVPVYQKDDTEIAKTYPRYTIKEATSGWDSSWTDSWGNTTERVNYYGLSGLTGLEADDYCRFRVYYTGNCDDGSEADRYWNSRFYDWYRQYRRMPMLRVEGDADFPQDQNSGGGNGFETTSDGQKCIYFDKKLDKATTWFQIRAGASDYVYARKQGVQEFNNLLGITVTKVAVEKYGPPVTAKATGVSVPQGTYYSGQTVPVTVTFDQFIVPTANTKLLVNGVECSVLDEVGVESNKITFGYTVKDDESGSIDVTGFKDNIANLKNSKDENVTVEGAFPDNASFGSTKKVYIQNKIKQVSLDLENAKYGINEEAEPGQHEVTVVIPFKENADVTWVGNESVECTTNGQGITMELPEYGEVQLMDYICGGYLSNDRGTTRYPLYVVRSGAEEKPVALAARMAPPINETAALRKDSLSLHLAPEIVIAETNKSKYMEDWATVTPAEEGQEEERTLNFKTDKMGFYYVDGSKKTDDAPVVIGANFSLFVTGGVKFDKDEFIPRGDESVDYASRVDDWGFLNLDDGNHILLNDPENPQNRYDVEIIANDKIYQALTDGARVEDPDDFTLTASFSDRKQFSFTRPRDIEWVSSNHDVITISKDKKTGVGHLQFTGAEGTAKLSLHVINGTEMYSYDLGTITLNTVAGKIPFMTISKFSQTRETIQGEDTEIPFASNLTARNAEFGKDTPFRAKLYRTEKVEDEETGETTTQKVGDPIWDKTFTSTVDDIVSHITVPGEILADSGEYAFELTSDFYGGEVGEGDDKTDLPAKTFKETATIVAEAAPAWVHLGTLDSYYVTGDNIPEITYTTSPEVTEVEYTIQKSTDTYGDLQRIKAENGVIPFSADMPESLKEVYIITVYARNTPEDEWGVDSMRLTVYNPSILHQIVADVAKDEIGGTTGGKGEAVDGKTINLDNHDKVQEYVGKNGYQLTFDDFNALRTDISLQKIVSLNYGEAVYGMLSDKMKWESSDPDTVSINYKQGGKYSDLRNYAYTSYAPATDFLLVGKQETGEDDAVKITATHANTGMNVSFDVTTDTLKDQLYMFQFFPAIETDITYTNGKGVKRSLKTDETGKLAVYEPDGIAGAVMAMSHDDNDTYTGSIYPQDFTTGERDVASLQLYPCNNLLLRSASKAELTFLTPNGQPYTGDVIIRGGAYKNGVYCPTAMIHVGNDTDPKNGREDIVASVENGKLLLNLDPTQFKIDPNDEEEQGAKPGDKITYVFEYRFTDSYAPGYVTLKASTDLHGESSPTDSVVYMRNNTFNDSTPQIIHQSIDTYFDGKKTEYSKSVIDYTDNIGVNKRFDKVVLNTDVALTGEEVNSDEKGYSVYTSDTVPHFILCTPNEQELTGQLDNQKKSADQIIKLADMEESSLFVFPFSSVPLSRSLYTITNEDLTLDGITDEGSNPNPTTAVKAKIVKDSQTIKTETLPFGVSNFSHQKDLSKSGGGAEEIGQEVESELKGSLDIGSIFKGINVNEMLQKGFVFLSSLTSVAGDPPIDMMIIPTDDPGTFRILASVGYNKREMDTETNPSLDFDPDHLYDDIEEFQKEMEELGKDDDDDDEDGGGEGSVDINFYGMIMLEAKVGVLGGKWDIDFLGGTVGTNFEAKYEWSQNFICGPVPVNISFEVKGTADLEVSFANKADARALLIDAAVGVSVEAFAGIGFDYSLFALKLGIFGRIGADVNFLYLTKGNQTGTKLNIAGEIGIKLKVKVLIVSYEKVFASTGFNWSKEYGKYSNIKETWENEGYAEMTGQTTSGRKFLMKLMPNGTAMVTIDGGSEIDNRNYLKSSPLKLNNQMVNLTMSEDGMLTLDDNAYPYSNPKFAKDGSMYLYVSDNDNADKPESVVHYAMKDEEGNYKDMGPVDTSEGNILADSDVDVSGSNSNTVFSTWVKQMDSPDKEMGDKTNFDDLNYMLNSTEIYAGYYSAGKWNVERLTDNTVADMAPSVASNNMNAIVAWRSLNATEMPEENEDGEAAQDISTSFNAKNSIVCRTYDYGIISETQYSQTYGYLWKKPITVYNGSAGTVTSLDTACLNRGVSMVAYTVRTGDDVNSSEIFYSIINGNEVKTTGRLTTDSIADTNVKVTAVGNSFIVAWYSEEKNEDNSVSHDIHLARINSDGTVDANFPERIGGELGSQIGPDFEFSAPYSNSDLNNLSIVWSQKKDSDKEEDSNKQELKAVRFFQNGNTIGFAEPITVAETGKNYAIDQFDTYTTSDGEVKSILVGSDYNDLGDMSVYDSIDLSDTELQVFDENNQPTSHLDILTNDPKTSIKLASGKYEKDMIEAEVNTDLKELVPGLELPVQFTVKNTGVNTVDEVTVTLDGESQRFEGLGLLPGQSTLLTLNYAVPEENITDVEYSLKVNEPAPAEPEETTDGSTGGTSGGTTEPEPEPEIEPVVTGTLVLNRPDVGIADIKVVREAEGKRDLVFTLNNKSEIPLAGSGKTVKLALYKDRDHKEQFGDTITIDSSNYQDIDNDIYALPYTVDLQQLIGDETDVPEDGVRLYARAWVEENNGDAVEELYTLNNDSNITLRGLLAKYQSPTTMNMALIEEDNDSGKYKVAANVTNNSLQEYEVGEIVADVLDSRNKVVKTIDVATAADDRKLAGEATKTFESSETIKLEDGQKVVLRVKGKSVFLNAEENRGTVDVTSIQLTADGKPAGKLPVATRNGAIFDGWYTAADDSGERVTNDTVLEPDSTIYAHFASGKKDQSFTVTMNDYEYDNTAHTPTIKGTTYGKVTTEYYDADTDEKLDKAPSEAGRYYVRVYADGNYYYNDCEIKTEYWITTPGKYHFKVTNGTLNGKLSGEFDAGDELTATANKPEVGDVFGGWKYNGEIVSNDAEYTFTASAENFELEAVYVENPKTPEEEAIADGIAIDLADAVLKDDAKARFVLTPTLADGWEVQSYGIVYDKNGVVTNAEEAKAGLVLDGSYTTKISKMLDGTSYNLNITPVESNTIWAVGYITVTKNGRTATIYTEPKSSNVTEMLIDKNVKLGLADAVLKDGTKARFVLTPEITDGWTVDAYGIVYDKNGAIKDAKAAKEGLVLGGEYVTKVSKMTDGTSYNLNITPVDDNTIWAVGYITVTKDGFTKTIYTDPKSANVSDLRAPIEAEIEENVKITLADAVLKDGTKARFVLTPEIAEGWTVDAYGIVYDKTGVIKTAEKAKTGLVVDGNYVTKISKMTDGTSYNLNITPVDDNTIWAVGYITATKDGVTKTIYTEPKSAKVSELINN